MPGQHAECQRPQDLGKTQQIVFKSLFFAFNFTLHQCFSRLATLRGLDFRPFKVAKLEKHYTTLPKFGKYLFFYLTFMFIHLSYFLYVAVYFGSLLKLSGWGKAILSFTSDPTGYSLPVSNAGGNGRQTDSRPVHSSCYSLPEDRNRPGSSFAQNLHGRPFGQAIFHLLPPSYPRLLILPPNLERKKILKGGYLSFFLHRESRKAAFRERDCPAKKAFVLTSEFLHLHQGVLCWSPLQKLLRQSAATGLQKPKDIGNGCKPT